MNWCPSRNATALLLIAALLIMIIPVSGLHVVQEATQLLGPAAASVSVVGPEKLEPVGLETTEFRVAGDLVGGNSIFRRRLAPFQLCLACKCCISAADPATCSTMPCCFGIDCQLPNKPFGVCAFVPKTCNCVSCAL